MRHLFGPVANRLGFEYGPNDSIDIVELRTTSTSTAAICGEESTLVKHNKRFVLLMDTNDESGLPRDLRTSIYTESVKYGGEKEYQKILEIYHASPTPSHKNSCAAALCTTTDPVLLNRTFNFICLPSVKSQDFVAYFGSLSDNPLTKRTLSAFFQENYDEFNLRLTGGFSIESLVRLAFCGFSSNEDADKVAEFFATKDASVYSQPLRQGLDAVRSKAARLSRDGGNVHAWLKKNDYIV